MTLEHPPLRLRAAEVQRLGKASNAVYLALAAAAGHAVPPPANQDRVGWSVLLSELPLHSHPIALARWRGRIDALALRTRYSNTDLYASFEPILNPAQLLFSLLEQNRVELLGAKLYCGVRDNLAVLAHERWIRAQPEGIVRTGAAWTETVAMLARIPLGAPLPASVRQNVTTTWRNWFTDEQTREIEALAANVEDQAAYARQSLRVIAATCNVTESCQLDLADPRRLVEPIHRARAPDATQSSRANSNVEAQTPNSGDPLAGIELRKTSPVVDGSATRKGSEPYRIYTTAFDQVALASQLCDSATLDRRRAELDRHIGRHVSNVARWAHLLQRRLLALQMRSWQFDCEEGLLDSARLTRVVTHPLDPLAYKIEREIEFPDSVVTLLVDNSGSMRGAAIASAAMCAELLSRTLELCGVKTEILGFTTRNWRGGRARAQWLAAGRPAHPGRVSELRHIIYKSADEPWRRARSRLGLMLESTLLAENVDGEALLWAHDRLLHRPEPRRILLVISDGAPMDDATIQLNDEHYLERHLHAVVERIECTASVELVAIGIGHDVSQYYRRAITLAGADGLGEALVRQLVELFDPTPRKKRSRHRYPPPGHRSRSLLSVNGAYGP
jgi:cobaltochelatase CobT